MSTALRKAGATLRARREHLGLTQEALAATAGISRAYLGEIERGAANVSIITLEKIAAALDLTLAQLFRSEERR